MLAKKDKNWMFRSEASWRNSEDGEKRRVNHEQQFADDMEKMHGQKIKIQGRRRLCKLSSQNGDDGVNVPANEDGGEFAELNDFDSPVLERKHGHVEKGGQADDIRDILNDLSSRFDLLSVEKKRAPKERDSTDECYLSVKGADTESKAVVPEYASAGSSFSLSSDSSNQLSAPPACSNISSFESDVHESTPSTTVEELVYPRQTALSDYEEDSDCIMLNEKSPPKKADRKICQNNIREKFSPKQADRKIDLITVTEKCDDSVDISGSHGDSSEFVLKGPQSTYRLPPEISKILYPYQLDGLRWLWSLHCKRKGGILGDDMGLGKTMQVRCCGKYLYGF